MAYADFAFYSGTYGGGLPADVFSGFEARASAYLDSVTFNRIGEAELADKKLSLKIKMAVCAIADIVAAEDECGGKSNETTSSYSVSYESKKELSSQKRSAARIYLGSTGLMYRGC